MTCIATLCHLFSLFQNALSVVCASWILVPTNCVLVSFFFFPFWAVVSEQLYPLSMQHDPLLELILSFTAPFLTMTGERPRLDQFRSMFSKCFSWRENPWKRSESWFLIEVASPGESRFSLKTGVRENAAGILQRTSGGCLEPSGWGPHRRVLFSASIYPL